MQVGVVRKVDAGEGAALQAVDGQNVAVKPAASDSDQPATRLRSSTSLAVAAGEIVTGAPFSVYAAVAATVSCGASFTATISSVVVAVVTAVPSDTVHDRVRCGLALKSVGLSLVDWNCDGLQQRLVVRDRARAAEDQRMQRRDARGT